MLTSVQKEILQTLINLYQSSDGKSIKGEDIAEVMGRNPGTIRNQMQSLRSLGLVKGVPGPRGGYKPTIEAYLKTAKGLRISQLQELSLQVFRSLVNVKLQ